MVQEKVRFSMRQSDYTWIGYFFTAQGICQKTNKRKRWKS